MPGKGELNYREAAWSAGEHAWCRGIDLGNICVWYWWIHIMQLPIPLLRFLTYKNHRHQESPLDRRYAWPFLGDWSGDGAHKDQNSPISKPHPAAGDENCGFCLRIRVVSAPATRTVFCLKIIRIISETNFIPLKSETGYHMWFVFPDTLIFLRTCHLKFLIELVAASIKFKCYPCSINILTLKLRLPKAEGIDPVCYSQAARGFHVGRFSPSHGFKLRTEVTITGTAGERQWQSKGDAEVCCRGARTSRSPKREIESLTIQ